MKQNEQEIQRGLQIREDIHHEIEKIGPSILLLQDTARHVTAQFEGFQKLVQNTQEQMKSIIKEASFEMAEAASGQFYSKIQDQVQNEVSALNQSVQTARKVLDAIETKGNLKTVLIVILSALIMIMGSFGLGYFYNKKTTYSLSKEVLETYGQGIIFQKVWPKLNNKEKMMIEKQVYNKN